ncbi:hypothetical protein ACSTS3_21180 [Aquimarina muelleri]|uniref:hypothetical protein n=1 Tax=Aquimarina muelleri TaxID=279356 RepID=UPI003F6843C4
MIAEFEEKEYENPLNTQLLLGNRNIWTPGQVFEGNFGIDAALEVTRRDFWHNAGFRHIPSGVILDHFDFGYVWRRLGRDRPLPTFKLNLFLQAKRPYGMQYRPATLRDQGLQSPYWRFEIKPHQQDLLLKLKRKLRNRAFVAYGCAAFHHYNDLFTHTENGVLVQNSTFIKVERLDGHHKWIYDQPGSVGFAMSEPEFIKDNNLFDEIEKTVETYEIENDNPSNNLKVLSSIIIEICEESDQKSFLAKEILNRYQRNRNIIGSVELRRFLNVINFSILTNSNWMVLK